MLGSAGTCKPPPPHPQPLHMLLQQRQSPDCTCVNAAGFQHERRVRLYDVDNNWGLRKDVEARNLRWTITDTCISPDQKFLLYSSISPIVHLVSMQNMQNVAVPISAATHHLIIACAALSVRCMLCSAAVHEEVLCTPIADHCRGWLQQAPRVAAVSGILGFPG